MEAGHEIDSFNYLIGMRDVGMELDTLARHMQGLETRARKVQLNVRERHVMVKQGSMHCHTPVRGI